MSLGLAAARLFPLAGHGGTLPLPERRHAAIDIAYRQQRNYLKFSPSLLDSLLTKKRRQLGGWRRLEKTLLKTLLLITFYQVN
ncbi:MAG: hypothetical protein JO174_05110 [Herbaspirillum sp.]|nr:hypothetical protein [Herbaspirillum sp.]